MLHACIGSIFACNCGRQVCFMTHEPTWFVLRKEIRLTWIVVDDVPEKIDLETCRYTYWVDCNREWANSWGLVRAPSDHEHSCWSNLTPGIPALRIPLVHSGWSSGVGAVFRRSLRGSA